MIIPDMVLKTEVLIVGAGLTGLLAALELAGQGVKVILVSRGSLCSSSSSRAQGGIAAPPADEISVESHLSDTTKAGAGLSDPSIARIIIEEGPGLIERLIELGVSFDRRQTGEFDLAREGGHSKARIYHSKDTTGSRVTESLIQRVRNTSGIRVLENARALQLIMSGRSCEGALIAAESKMLAIYAARTLLSTGGLGRIYSRSTNPPEATGEGIAMAYRAGADLIDMEFVQFHPTVLCLPGEEPFLISEAVRGAGAHLVDHRGQRFAFRFHPDGELATRDIVSRAMLTVMEEEKQMSVWLDLKPIGRHRIEESFPGIVTQLRKHGIDPTADLVPVAPAAHYFMGGILSDAWGRTSLERLYAAGECACTGLHGANRLASNSLLEAGVMARRVAKDICAQEFTAALPGVSIYPIPVEVPSDINLFKEVVYRFAGVRRSGEGLEELLEFSKYNHLPACDLSVDLIDAASTFLLARLIAMAALLREESRGAHWRADYPEVDDKRFARRLLISKYYQRWIAPASEPVDAVNTRSSLIAE